MALIGHLLKRVFTKPSWLAGLFFLLVCLLPFTGGTLPFRDDSSHLLNPFGFSLMTPSRRAFGPYEMLSLASFLIIPWSLMFWRTEFDSTKETVTQDAFAGCIMPCAACSLYAIYLILALPLIIRTNAFPNSLSILLVLIDLLLRSAILAWPIDFILRFASPLGVKILTAWIAATVLYLGINMFDSFLFAYSQIRRTAVPSVSFLVFHAALAFAFSVFSLALIRLTRRLQNGER